MKEWMRIRLPDTHATRKAAEAFNGGLLSAYYSNNTSPGSPGGFPQKNLVRRFTDLDDQNARMVEY
jgi:hypothetical protein